MLGVYKNKRWKLAKVASWFSPCRLYRVPCMKLGLQVLNRLKLSPLKMGPYNLICIVVFSCSFSFFFCPFPFLIFLFCLVISYNLWCHSCLMFMFVFLLIPLFKVANPPSTWCCYLSSSSMLLLVLLLVSLLNVVVHSPSRWYYLSSFDAIVAKL